MENYINTNEACEVLGVSAPTLRRLRRNGMPHYNVGSHVKFLRSEIVAWVSGAKESAPVANHGEAGACPGENVGQPNDTTPEEVNV